LLLTSEHVSADARDLEVVGDIEELAKRRLVAAREPLRERLVEPSQLRDLTEHDDVGSLPDVDLGSGHERKAGGMEDSTLAQICSLEMLVDLPVLPRVKVLGQRNRMQARSVSASHHAGDDMWIEREVLRDVRVRVGVDPLQCCSSRRCCPPPSTVIHIA